MTIEEGLTTYKPGLKYRKFREKQPSTVRATFRIYDLKADPFSPKRQYEAAL